MKNIKSNNFFLFHCLSQQFISNVSQALVARTYRGMYPHINCTFYGLMKRVMMFNATFNNISVIYRGYNLCCFVSFIYSFCDILNII